VKEKNFLKNFFKKNFFLKIFENFSKNFLAEKFFSEIFQKFFSEFFEILKMTHFPPKKAIKMKKKKHLMNLD